MRKRKKTRQKRTDFYLGVALYTFFSVVALIFVTVIFAGNVQNATGVNREKVSVVVVAQADPADNYNKIMDEAEAYIRQNIAALAKADNAGGGGSTVDSVDFINTNRALIFYHENSDNYLAEAVFNDNIGLVKVEKFILKVKNDTDYSGGVYGAD
ncbi:MAG: hypothetical protein PHO56_00305 [Patescibacteria group bacterium]|nr:hypothetical protein [Patescibacteria group bacterium]